jgi:WD40 repeat protein
LAFSPDGRRLLSGAEYSRVQLWDPGTGKELSKEGEFGRDAWMGAFAPDGKSLALWGGDHAIHLWDLGRGREREISEGHTSDVLCFAISPDGKTVASGSYDGLRLWETATGRTLHSAQGPGSGTILCVTFSPDGKTVAAGGYDSTVILWETATGRELRRLKTGEAFVHSLAYSPDGKTLYSGEFDLIETWDPGTGRCIRQLGDKRKFDPGEQDFSHVSSLAVSPDGKTLVASHRDRLRLFSTETGAEIAFPDEARAAAFVFSPDGRTLLSSFGGLWETASGRKRSCLQSDRLPRTSTTFAPEGKRLVSVCEDGRIHLWSAATGKELHVFPDTETALIPVRYAPDGKTLLSAKNTAILIWDMANIPARPASESLPNRSVEDLWNDLAGTDACVAHQAIWALVADPKRSVPFIEKNLRPAPEPDRRQLKQWLADLDSDDFAVRQQAARGLEKLEEAAESALQARLQAEPSAEVRRTVERLLARLHEPWLTGQRLRQVRAVEALEQTGTEGARQLLEALAGGAKEARLTREAKSSLRRLDRTLP